MKHEQRNRSGSDRRIASRRLRYQSCNRSERLEWAGGVEVRVGAAASFRAPAHDHVPSLAGKAG